MTELVPSTHLNTPMLWINTYLQEKIAHGLKVGLPFFPSMPASIDDLTEQWVFIAPTDEDPDPNITRYSYSGVMATWDRLIRMRRSPFPHIKQEQALYYFYATQSDVTNWMVQIQEAVLRLLDREDESAEEINTWARKKGSILVKDGSNEYLVPPEFYFHRFRVYQLEEVRDIIDFGTARTYGGNKIIIDFEYHQDTSISSS
jgi:hypothetical protein